MVNYDWELRYYRGCLIAVSSKCIAYALRGNKSSLSTVISNIRDCFSLHFQILRRECKMHLRKNILNKTFSFLDKW